jgi:nucleotide-binding universal stress UspA family protein
MSAFRKILVPTDFSPHAAEAFRVAHDLAKATGTSVAVFHCPVMVGKAPVREAGPPTHPTAAQPAVRVKS